MNVAETIESAATTAKVSAGTSVTTSFALLAGQTFQFLNEYAAAIGSIIAILTFVSAQYWKRKEYKARRVAEEKEREFNRQIRLREIRESEHRRDSKGPPRR